MQKQLSECAEHPPTDISHEGKSHNVEELEKVVNAMKKVIAKLQMENENLKRVQGAPKPTQAKADGVKKMTALQEQNSKLKVSNQHPYK